MVSKKLFVAVVLLFTCFGMLLSSMEVKDVKATIISVDRTFSGNAYDGYATKLGTNYAVVQASSTASDVDDSFSRIYVGQYKVDIDYELYRGFVVFDTSLIPSTANIISATLSIYLYTNVSTTDFNVSIQNGQPLYPYLPLQLGDYWQGWYSGDGGNRSTSEISALSYWNITLSASGLTWLNTSGLTKLCIRSDRDINAVAPSGAEYISFYSTEQGAAYAPKLYVTYETVGYHYIVHGPYYESGAVANCISNVTLYSKTSDPYTFFLNGTDSIADTEDVEVEQAGWYFQWNVSATKTRSYYLSAVTFDEFWVYVTDSSKTYATYTIAFLDWAGVLKTMPYVSVERYIDGLKIVEKQKADVEKKVTFYLEAYTAYTIVLEDTTVSYTFGDVMFSDLTTITLTVKSIDFPKETLFKYKYVRVYGERALGDPLGNLTIMYQDTLNLTNSVTIQVNFKNGSAATTPTIYYTDSFVYSWLSAANDTDYAVVLTIDHGTYGVYTWKQYFPRGFSTMPWGLDWLGTLPFNTAYLIPAIIILFAGAGFSVVNAYVGAFVMVVVAAILSYIGWIPISGAVLVTAFTFAVIMAIIYAKRRIQA